MPFDKNGRWYSSADRKKEDDEKDLQRRRHESVGKVVDITKNLILSYPFKQAPDRPESVQPSPTSTPKPEPQKKPATGIQSFFNQIPSSVDSLKQFFEPTFKAIKHDITHPKTWIGLEQAETTKSAQDTMTEFIEPGWKLADTLRVGADAAQQKQEERRADRSVVAQELAPMMNQMGQVAATWAGGKVLAPLKVLQGLKILNQTKTLGGAALKATLPKVAQTTGEKALATLGNAAIVAGGEQALEGAFTPNKESDNLAVDLGKGLRRFGGNQYETAGYGAKMLGFDNLGNTLIKTGEKQNEGFASTREFEGGWSDMLDPYYWAGVIGENAPTSLAFIPMGLLGRTLGAAGASTMKMGAFGTAVMEGLGVAGLTAPLEAAMEASQSFESKYKESLQSGMTEEQAKSEGRNAGEKTFWGNMALLGVSNAVQFGHIFGPANKALNRIGADTTAGKVLGGAMIEGGQEMAQQAIQDTATGKPVDWLSPEYVSQGIFGATMGGVYGLAGASMDADIARSHVQAIQNRVINKLDDETKGELNQAIADARAQGIPEDQAMATILDTIAENHPKGKAIVQEATREVALSAQELMNQERFSQQQQIMLKGGTAQQQEALKQTDPHGTLIGFDPVAQASERISLQPESAKIPSSRPKGPVQPFEQGEFVRLSGMPGVYQVADNQQGKKRKVTGQDGKVRDVPPQALRKFDALQKGDQVTVAGTEGVFTIADLRDGKRIRVRDDDGNTFHFGTDELTPAFGAAPAAASKTLSHKVTLRDLPPDAYNDVLENAQQDLDLEWAENPNEQTFELRELKMKDLEKAVTRPLKLSDVDMEMVGQTRSSGSPIIVDDDLSVLDGMHRIADAVSKGDETISAYVRVPNEQASSEAPSESADVTYKKMKERLATSGGTTAAHKVKLLQEMQQFAIDNNIEFKPYHQELLEKFTAEEIETAKTKEQEKDEKKEEIEQAKERQRQHQEKMTKLRQNFVEEAKQHDTFDAFNKFMSDGSIPSDLRGSQSRDSFLRDLYAEAHGETPLAERNPYNGRVGESVAFEGPNGNELIGTISKIIDDKFVGVDVLREDGKGTIPYKVLADEIQQARKVEDVGVGDTITLRGMGDQKFTVDAIKSSMVSLTGEKGGKLDVHKQAIASVLPGAVPASELEKDAPHIILWVPDATDPAGKPENREVYRAGGLIKRLKELNEKQLRHIAEAYDITGAGKQEAEALTLFIAHALVRNEFNIPKKGLKEIFEKSMKKIQKTVSEAAYERIKRMVKKFQNGTVDFRIDNVLFDTITDGKGMTAINFTDLKTDQKYFITLNPDGETVLKGTGYEMKRDYPKTLAEWTWDNYDRTILPVGESDWIGWTLFDRTRVKRAAELRNKVDQIKWKNNKPEMNGNDNDPDFSDPTQQQLDAAVADDLEATAYGRSGNAAYKKELAASHIDPDSSDGRDFTYFFEKYYNAGRNGKFMPHADIHQNKAREFYDAGKKDAESAAKKPQAEAGGNKGREKAQATENVDGNLSQQVIVQNGKVTVTSKVKNLDHELLPRGFDEDTPQMLSHSFEIADWEKAERSHANPNWARRKFIEKQIDVDKVREKLNHHPVIERIMDAQIRAINKAIELQQQRQTEQEEVTESSELNKPRTRRPNDAAPNGVSDEEYQNIQVGDIVTFAIEEKTDGEGNVTQWRHETGPVMEIQDGLDRTPLVEFKARHADYMRTEQVTQERIVKIEKSSVTDDLSTMTGKELAAEAERLRVPSWGNKSEIIPRIEKARRARQALEGKTAEDLDELSRDDLEKIMLDADMLPTEAGNERNKTNHIRRLLEWRDGKKLSKDDLFMLQLKADYSEVKTITDAQRETLDNFQTGKQHAIPYAVYALHQEQDNGQRIVAQFMVQSPTDRGYTEVNRIIEPDGGVTTITQDHADEIGMMKMIYENKKAAAFIEAREPKPAEPTKEQHQEQHRDSGEVQVRPGFTIEKGDHVGHHTRSVSKITGINKKNRTVMLGGGRIPTAFDDIIPLEEVVKEEEKQAIREFIENDMDHKHHLLRVAYALSPVLRNVVIFNTDDMKMGTYYFTHNNRGIAELTLLDAPTKPARPPKGTNWNVSGRHDQGTKGFDDTNYITLWEIPDSYKNAAGETAPVGAKQYLSEEELDILVASSIKPAGDFRAQQIADGLKALIRNGTEIKSGDLFRIADDVYRGSQAKGTYTPKDAYDALELAVNQYLLEQTEMDLTARDTAAVKENVEKLAALTSKLPTQTKRTEEQERFQQFSTPPAIAYVGSWIANITSEDTVLEPSAGIGGMAVFGKANGATVIVNELDPRRLELLKNMPFDQFFKEDGEQIHNIMPKSVQPTVVIMNPPFSTSATRGVTATKNSFNHVDQALKRLENGGRLVAILGLGREGNSKSFNEWIDKLQNRSYAVKAVVGIDGKNYVKYGTSYDVQFVIIDKMDAQAKPLVTKVDTLDKVIDLLGGIASERQGNAAGNLTGEPNADQSTGAAGTPQGSRTRPGASRNGQPGSSGSASTVGDSGRRPTAPVDEPGSNVQPTDEIRGPVDATATDERINDVGRSDDDNAANAAGDTGTSSDESAGSLDQQEDQPGNNSNQGRPGDVKELTDAIFEDYAPKKLNVKNVKPHPGQLAESAAMSAIDLPDLTYKLSLPKEVIESGALSDAQVEAVAYAGQAHNQMLPDGKIRKGIFIGDGTGVGKGREVSGIILDNFNKGRTKAVWVSENDGLLSDSRAYWAALGGDPEEVFKKPKLGEAIQQKRGIAYTTYNTLASGFGVNPRELEAQGKSAKQSRLNQLVEWLGPDFDGVIVFDEAHNMANAVDQKGARGVKKAAQKALAGLDLQQRLPNARIVYASATGATEVSNLAYAERLGLWGTGTAFPNQVDFINKINAGGIAAMELVARDMKAMGVYIARNLSYNGVEYQKITHDLTKDQTQIYDLLARSWQVVLQNINAALEVTGITKDGKTLSGRAKSNAVGQFWGAQQRFFNQVLTAMQMPSVIEEAKKDLAAGKALVLQIVNTNEASQDRGIAKIEEEEGDLEDLDLTPREILLQFIDKSFPVEMYEEYQDDSGNKRSRPVLDSQGKPVISAEAVEMKDDLMAQLSSVKVPEGPLELMLNNFGVDDVAEITGRSQRVVERQNENTGRVERVLEKRSFHSKEADVDAFMAGKKNILIFSNAGGTGRSYHADNTKLNKKQRMHYLIQAGWEATKAVQGFGRTHRTNQASAPVYKLFTTNLKGQMRFVSSIARRLDQLGALTKGQRQTGSQGLFSAADNLESNIAKHALVQFYSMLARDQISYLDKYDVLGKMGLADKILTESGNFNDNADELAEVTKFLNRILTLESGLQNEVFEAFQHIVERMTQIAIQDGTLDTGLENIKADSTKIAEEQDIRRDEATGSVTKYYQLELGHKTVPMKLKDLMKREDFQGVYRNERSKAIRTIHENGNKTLASGRVVKRYFMQGPEKFDYKYIDEEELARSKWEKLPTQSEIQEELDDTILALQAGGLSQAEATKTAKSQFLTAEGAWQQGLDELPKYRQEKVHMISGTLLPVWDRLPTDRVRVVRALTDNGDILLGRIISENAIDQTLHNLGAEKRSKEIDTDSLADKILDGFTVHLANGWKLSRRKVTGEWRIELTGDYLYRFNTELKAAGVFAERIGVDFRYFVPTGEEANKVIKELIKHRPVAEVVPPTSSAGGQQGFAAPLAGAQSQPTPALAATKPVKRSTIYQHITKNFKVPIGTGRYRRRALGIYTQHITEIRTKHYGNFVVLSHELGHRLDDLYGISKQPALNAELMLLASTLQIPPRMPKVEQRAEGFAEFMRRYLYDPASAQSDAPLTFQVFEDTLTQHRQFTAMRELYALLQSWHFQGARESVQGVTDLASPRSKIPSAATINDVLYEELGGIDRGINRVVGGRKNAPQGSKNPYHVAWRTRGAAGRIKAFLHWGVTDENGNKTGKSLEEILNKKNVPDLALFRDYLLALRAKELHEQGKWLTPISVRNADLIIQAVENGPDASKYEDAAADLYDYQNAVTDVLVNGGFLAPSTVDQWRKEHLFYVPFYRVLEESGTREGSSGRTSATGGSKFANLNNPVKSMKLEGSPENIIDPLESIIKNTYLFLSLASRNEAGMSLVDFIQNTKDSASIAAIVPPKTKVQKFMLLEIADALEAAGFDLNDPKLNLTKFATIFRQTFHPDPAHRILNVWKNGDITQVQIRDEAMYESYLMLNSPPIHPIWRILGLPNNILKAGVVLSPSFIPKNVMRGLPTMLMQSDSFTNPKDYAQLPWMLIKNFGSALFHGKAFWEWASRGGAHSTLNSINETYMQDSSNHILRSNWKQLLVREGKSLGIGMILRALRHISESTDSPLRMAEDQMTMKKTGDPVLAAVRSRDVDLDFNRFGSGTRSFNAANAFFNIALQGPNRAYRTFRDHPYRTLIRGSLFITVPTVLLYMLNRDDEEYWKLPQWERDLFWIIPTGLDGPLRYVKIPIPFEWGILFKTLPERMMASNLPLIGFGDLGGKAFHKLHETALGMLIPTMLPTLLEPMLEWLTGQNIVNIMNATPLVPQRLQHKAPEEQAKATTSEAAKGIGNATRQSPIKIENLVTGYTGTLGAIGLKAADELLKKTGITDPPPAPSGSYGLGLFGDQGLFAKTFFTSPEARSSETMDDFYTRLKKLENAHSRNALATGNPVEELSEMRKTSERLAAIRAMQESIRESKNTTPGEKRTIIDKMAVALNDLAADAIGQEPKDLANMKKMRNYALHFSANRTNEKFIHKWLDKITRTK